MIEPRLKDIQNKVPINGSFLYSHLTKYSETDGQVSEITNQLNVKIAIYYFIRIVQAEFARCPDSKVLRDVIKRLNDLQFY